MYFSTKDFKLIKSKINNNNHFGNAYVITKNYELAQSFLNISENLKLFRVIDQEFDKINGGSYIIIIYVSRSKHLSLYITHGDSSFNFSSFDILNGEISVDKCLQLLSFMATLAKKGLYYFRWNEKEQKINCFRNVKKIP